MVHKMVTHFVRALAAIGFLVIVWQHTLIIHWVLDLRFWILEHGALGVAAYFMLFVSLLQLMMPTTTLELLAGFMFGFRLGALVAVGAEVVGTAISFVLGRWCFRESIDKLLEGYPVWSVLRSAISTGVWRGVIILRLAYIPLPLKNYGLAVLPEVSVMVSLGSLLISDTPITMTIVYIGSTLASIVQVESGGEKGDPLQLGLMCFLITINIVLGIAISWFTRQAMKEKETQSMGLNEGSSSAPLLSA